MSLNVDTVLNNIAKNYDPTKANNRNSNATVDANIFAQASSLVAEYKAQQKEAKNNNNNSGSTKICGLNFTDVANMSTSDFLKYAYENQAASGFKQNNSNQNDSSEIKLPLIVSYKGRVVCTAGKNFMAVVAKIKAKCPATSEEKIAAELLAKYGDNSTTNTKSTKSSSGNKVNLSA